ncbi:MAG: CapA family protein [Marvinbryantia sp.]|uniref:CapA family protein n=1 Tax=Marvinbryantia sp. TaxID=2496532 RepID=UPI0025D2E0CF|nr:CapA family protein [uncultured Marvinbryantia sp.]
MKKQNAMQRFIGRLTGSHELEQAEQMLGGLLLAAGDDGQRREIGRIRKLIRKYRRERRTRLCIAGGALCIVLAALILWMATVMSEKGTADKSGVQKSASAPDRKNASALPEVGIQDVLLGEGQSAPPAQTEKQEETEEIVKLEEPVELLLSFTGDCILGTDEYFAWDTGFNAYYDMYGADYFLENVRDIFQKDDLTIVNMEGTLTEETTRVEKQFAFKGKPEFVKILASSSVEAANMANNHSHDYGEQSFLDTVDILEQNHIRTFGYDDTALMEVKGVRVGIFGIYELDDHLERTGQVKSNIAKLKQEGADIIVAVFHWSNELVTVPDENQVTLAHLAIDEGADVVVGHHPHVLQGIGTYKGKTIAYSLGNFCFGGNTHPTETDTVIFQQRFVINTDREITESKTNLIPCSVSSDSTINNYQPTPLTGEEAERVLNLIDERSRALMD